MGAAFLLLTLVFQATSLDARRRGTKKMINYVNTTMARNALMMIVASDQCFLLALHALLIRVGTEG